jgi:hypothetical protein
MSAQAAPEMESRVTPAVVMGCHGLANGLADFARFLGCLLAKVHDHERRRRIAHACAAS